MPINFPELASRLQRWFQLIPLTPVERRGAVFFAAVVIIQQIDVPAVPREAPREHGSRLDGPVDVRQASEEELSRLPGIGPVMARRIMDWREGRDGFISVEALLEVKGIGPARLEQLRPFIRVDTRDSIFLSIGRLQEHEPRPDSTNH